MLKQYRSLMRKLFMSEKGMEAMETVVIIAGFAVMIGVFVFITLNGGMSIAERGQDVVHAGMQQVTTDLEVSGPIVVTSTDDGTVKDIIFVVKKAFDANPIDMTSCDGTASSRNKVIFNLISGGQQLDNIKWSKEAIGASNKNSLLENGEQFQIRIDLMDLGDGKILTTPLGVGSTFNVQVKLVDGSVLISIQKTLPPQLEPVMDLH